MNSYFFCIGSLRSSIKRAVVVVVWLKRLGKLVYKPCVLAGCTRQLQSLTVVHKARKH